MNKVKFIDNSIKKIVSNLDLIMSQSNANDQKEIRKEMKKAGLGGLGSGSGSNSDNSGSSDGSENDDDLFEQPSDPNKENQNQYTEPPIDVKAHIYPAPVYVPHGYHSNHHGVTVNVNGHPQPVTTTNHHPGQVPFTKKPSL